MMKKVLFVITGLGLGGAEKVVVDLAESMSALGCEVKIAYLTGDVVVQPTSKDIEIISLNLNSVKNIPFASKRYIQLIKKFRPDVVHAHMVHANIFTRLNRIVCSVPKLICTAHNSNEGGRLRMLAYRATNYLSDFNTNVSEEASAALISKGAFTKKNLITVYNGINLDKFEKNSNYNGLNENSLNLIAVGRFSKQKDYPNLINAFSLLVKSTDIKLNLTIVGDGELRPEIETLIEEFKLSNNITLLGRRSDIPKLLSQADIFVLSSKHEGLPTVVIEAMACECYVVATDCGGSAEILGDTGMLVPIQNSLSLASALEYAISLSVEDRLENNKKARKRVEELFSLETSIKKWLAFYEEE